MFGIKRRLNFSDMSTCILKSLSIANQNLGQKLESSDEVSVTFYGADIVMFLCDLSMPLFAKVPHLTTVNS
jgi:hypothetical protein